MMRSYNPSECAVFWKVSEPFGELSNMAGGFPISAGGLMWTSAEALYQACRFPEHPEVQLEILETKSGMAAKMQSKRHTALTRPDWSDVRVRVMRWCLALKLAQHRESFSAALLATDPRPIVERSSRDRYWGAVLETDGQLRGENVLGRLLQELREAARTEGLTPPPAIPDVPRFALPVDVGGQPATEPPRLF